MDIIKQLNPDYNQTNGGEITKGRKFSRETVEKIRLGNLGKKRTQEQKDKLSIIKKNLIKNNKKYRDSLLKLLEKGRESLNKDRSRQIAAASISCKNRIWSDESRKKLSKSRIGISNNSKVTIDKIAEINMKPVLCITSNIMYESISDAANETGFSISGISKVCLGQRNFIHKNKFKFITKDLYHEQHTSCSE